MVGANCYFAIFERKPYGGVLSNAERIPPSIPRSYQLICRCFGINP